MVIPSSQAVEKKKRNEASKFAAAPGEVDVALGLAVGHHGPEDMQWPLGARDWSL